MNFELRLNGFAVAGAVMLAGLPGLGVPRVAQAAPCIDGTADGYDCRRIDLLAAMSLQDLQAARLNDIWGWVDPLDGREYAVVGHINGTSFVDITDPLAPRLIGVMPAHEEQAVAACAGKATAPRQSHDDDAGVCGEHSSAWRDIKTYGNHAYVVSESAGHGLQVFDLTQLRDVAAPPATFAETNHYAGFGSAHNLAIDEQTGFAYVVGSDTFAGGPHFVDLSDPANPVAAGGFAGDGYTHDAQCLVYRGPDAAHRGRELCFNANEDTLTILDVTNKAAPMLISRAAYGQSAYAHQGWLSEDQRYYFMNDELDERRSEPRTRTIVWDLGDLEAPRVVANYLALVIAVDHNNYGRGRYLFQSNYKSGLRVLDVSRPATPVEIGYFDSDPGADELEFEGSWSNYPYYPSGTIAVSDIDGGLFLLEAGWQDSVITDVAVEITGAGSGDGGLYTYTVTVSNVSARPANDVFVDHYVPPGVTVSGVDGPVVCARSSIKLACEVGSLNAGESRELVVELQAPANDGYALDVRVNADELDSDTANNSDGDIVQVRTVAAAGNGGGDGGGGGGAVLWLVLCLLPGLRVRKALTLVPATAR